MAGAEKLGLPGSSPSERGLLPKAAAGGGPEAKRPSEVIAAARGETDGEIDSPSPPLSLSLALCVCVRSTLRACVLSSSASASSWLPLLLLLAVLCILHIPVETGSGASTKTRKARVTSDWLAQSANAVLIGDGSHNGEPLLIDENDLYERPPTPGYRINLNRMPTAAR